MFSKDEIEALYWSEVARSGASHNTPQRKHATRCFGMTRDTLQTGHTPRVFDDPDTMRALEKSGSD